MTHAFVTNGESTEIDPPSVKNPFMTIILSWCSDVTRFTRFQIVVTFTNLAVTLSTNSSFSLFLSFRFFLFLLLPNPIVIRSKGNILRIKRFFPKIAKCTVAVNKIGVTMWMIIRGERMNDRFGSAMRCHVLSLLPFPSPPPSLLSFLQLFSLPLD